MPIGSQIELLLGDLEALADQPNRGR